jgi:hypothetical protein
MKRLPPKGAASFLYEFSDEVIKPDSYYSWCKSPGTLGVNVLRLLNWNLSSYKAGINIPAFITGNKI